MRSKNIFSTLLVILITLILFFAGYTFFKDLDGPIVKVLPETTRVSPATTLKISMKDPSGIRSISVGIKKNNVVNVIFKKHFTEYLPEQSVDISLKNANLREGAFDIEIKATDASLAGFGQGNTRTVLIPLRLDLQPPKISIKTLPANARRGGSAMIRYTVDEEISKSGVLIAGYFVPGFLQKDGTYICFFPFPYSMTAQEFKNSLEITATDLAENTTKSRLPIAAFEKTFKSDKIDLQDSFLQLVQNKLSNLTPNATTALDCYLTINSQVRMENVQALREISKDTSSAMLWNGSFVRLPRSAARAGFADHRFFNYQGKLVGESYHLGFDFASVKNAEVPAANSGRVIFVGELGVYGNLIIIDHGLGIMSLYAHLSEFLVNKGDVVQKSQIIAKTGSTGLAFGDHLHFGILVGGIEVNPLEWIDPKWIRDNIIGRM